MSPVHNDNLFKWRELEMTINQGATIDQAELKIARTLERVFVFFSSSTHRWDALTTVTRQGVKHFIDAHFSARHDAVNVISNHYSEIPDVL